MRREPEPGEVEDRMGEQGEFRCPNCGPSVFQIKIEDSEYKEVCTQGCDYQLSAPIWIVEENGETKEQISSEEIEISGIDN